MFGAHVGALAVQRSADVHQAGVVAGGTNLGLRLLDVLQFFLQQRSRNVGVLDGEGTAEATSTNRQLPSELIPARVHCAISALEHPRGANCAANDNWNDT